MGDKTSPFRREKCDGARVGQIPAILASDESNSVDRHFTGQTVSTVSMLQRTRGQGRTKAVQSAETSSSVSFDC